MNYDLLNKLTIVIFTFNRHRHLKRTLDYWSNYNVRLVILDGSDQKFEDPCIKIKNITYVYSKNGLYERLLSSIKYIDTEFMLLAADDEFYLPSALSSCINFLIKNPTYSSCGGRAIGFGFDPKKKLYGKNIYSKLSNLTLNEEDSKDRIIKHFSNYVPAHLYSVIPTKKWKKICPFVFQKKYNFFGSPELILEFLVMVSGKSQVIQELMWMRSHGVPQITHDLPQIKIQNWWFDKRFKDEKLSFLKKMKIACDELLTNNNLVFSEQAIARLFEVYIDQLLKEDLPNKNFLKKLLILTKVKKIKKYFLKWFKIRAYKYKSLVNEVNTLQAQRVLVNHDELNKVISTLQNFKN